MTRGLSLNNPGNIEHGSPWKGLSDFQPDNRFCNFISPEYGIRAMCEIYQTYERKYHLFTIEEWVTRYAPPEDNDTEKYIQDVAKWSGFARDEKIDANDPASLLKWIPAVIRKEQGQCPYDEATLERGIALSI